MSKKRFQLTPSVYLVLIRENKILLSQRFNTGYFDNFYSLPAGHLNGDETLKQAIVREAKEEISIILNSEDLELVHAMNRKIPDDERIDFFFTSKKWQGKPKIMEPNKCNDLRWFGVDNLPEKLIPYIKQAINSIKKNIIYSERKGKEE